MVRRKEGKSEEPLKPLPEQVRDVSKSPVDEKEEEINLDRLVPTGSTLMNLACSDNESGGFALGKMVNLIGDSDSGKTAIVLTTLAEVCRMEQFDSYDLVYDDTEAAMEFNLEKLFGKSMASRVTVIKSSHTIQEFQNNILNAVEKGTPFIYVLDTLDALTSDQEIEKADAKRKGKKTAGSYGMDKAKGISQMLRMVVRAIRDTESLLIIISQTRDNIDPMSFVKKTRSGGKALKFYATQEIWVAVGGKIKSRDRQIGVNSIVKVERSKLTGKKRTIKFPIYYDYGVDDIESCIDFMVNEGEWPVDKKTITAQGLGISGTKRSLVRQIEEGGLERELQKIVGGAWCKIEDSIKLNRKPRYE